MDWVQTKRDNGLNCWAPAKTKTKVAEMCVAQVSVAEWATAMRHACKETEKTPHMCRTIHIPECQNTSKQDELKRRCEVHTHQSVMFCWQFQTTRGRSRIVRWKSGSEWLTKVSGCIRNEALWWRSTMDGDWRECWFCQIYSTAKRKYRQDSPKIRRPWRKLRLYELSSPMSSV